MLQNKINLHVHTQSIGHKELAGGCRGSKAALNCLLLLLLPPCVLLAGW